MPHNSTNWDRKYIVSGIIMPLLAVVFAFILQFQQDYRSLSYEIIDASPLIITGEFSQNLELKYKDRKVTDPHLVIYKITNSGSQPIGENDYADDIQIDLGENTSILETSSILVPDLGYDFPEDLISQANDSHRINIKPTLLNSKESLLLKFIVENLDINAIKPPLIRIAGIAQALPTSSVQPRYYIPLKFSKLVLLFGTVALSMFIVGLILKLLPTEFNIKTFLVWSLMTFLFFWSLLGLLAVRDLR